MKKNVIVLIGLIIILFAVNYSFLDSLLINLFDEGEVVIVEKVIDGDTIVAGKVSVRLLGINSPERKEQYYEEAREFLEDAVLNKTVILKFGKEKQDKYNRTLAYVFVGNKNLNLEMVKNGFANFYFPSGRDVYYDDFKSAWEECEENLCERSADECADCIELEEFDYENEIVVFYNKCDFDCELTEWEIKDEGRKSFVFPEFVLGVGKNVKVIVSEEDVVDNQEEVFWRRKDYVWTDSGDTLFLRDSKGKLVLWENY
ncbi:thermonuclease family protein [Candidatus Pacearchaeota archaeon]|nr:thermonuclease family protein [Candidatus Pacearchaeota archaeon]